LSTFLTVEYLFLSSMSMPSDTEETGFEDDFDDEFDETDD
jgi:hypothetical protein